MAPMSFGDVGDMVFGYPAAWRIGVDMEPLFNLDGCRFVTCGNDHGLAGPDTVFLYHQQGVGLSGEYHGGEVAEGRFVGHYVDLDRLELLFECMTRAGHLCAGRSLGTVSRDYGGKLRLAFEWTWLYGADGGGISAYVEV